MLALQHNRWGREKGSLRGHKDSFKSSPAAVTETDSLKQIPQGVVKLAELARTSREAQVTNADKLGLVAAAKDRQASTRNRKEKASIKVTQGYDKEKTETAKPSSQHRKVAAAKRERAWNAPRRTWLSKSFAATWLGILILMAMVVGVEAVEQEVTSAAATAIAAIAAAAASKALGPNSPAAEKEKDEESEDEYESEEEEPAWNEDAPEWKGDAVTKDTRDGWVLGFANMQRSADIKDENNMWRDLNKMEIAFMGLSDHGMNLTKTKVPNPSKHRSGTSGLAARRAEEKWGGKGMVWKLVEGLECGRKVTEGGAVSAMVSSRRALVAEFLESRNAAPR